MPRGRGFPLYVSAKGGFAIDEGVNYDMGKLLCALTMHHGERVMNDDQDDDELPVDYLFKDPNVMNGPDFFACVKKIVQRVVPDYTLDDIIVEDAKNYHPNIEGAHVSLSFAELEDRITFILNRTDLQDYSLCYPGAAYYNLVSSSCYSNNLIYSNTEAWQMY